MNSKQLIKIIKTIVEAETAKHQEHFLSKTFPSILEEEVDKRLKELKGGVSSPPALVVQDTDALDQANQVADTLNMSLEQKRVQVKEHKHFTKNKVLNNILNQTKPFSKSQRSGGPIGSGGESVLDSLPQQTQQPIVEENTHIPSYMDAEPDIDQTVSMGTSLGAGGTDALRAQMSHKLGYGDVSQGPSRQGLGVKTGLAGLDRILNRDNSSLVKKFKR